MVLQRGEGCHSSPVTTTTRQHECQGSSVCTQASSLLVDTQWNASPQQSFLPRVAGQVTPLKPLRCLLYFFNNPPLSLTLVTGDSRSASWKKNTDLIFYVIFVFITCFLWLYGWIFIADYLLKWVFVNMNGRHLSWLNRKKKKDTHSERCGYKDLDIYGVNQWEATRDSTILCAVQCVAGRVWDWEALPPRFLSHPADYHALISCLYTLNDFFPVNKLSVLSLK